jgi:hypothetical protein
VVGEPLLSRMPASRGAERPNTGKNENGKDYRN